MPHDSAVVSIEELLEHRGWVTELARSLVRDVHHADEAVQNTWLAALLTPPRSTESRRAWLGTVVRNFVRLGHRIDSRRTRRESGAAPREAMPPRADPLEQLETQSAVIAAVRALPAPYREVIVLRYFQELTPSDIADRTNTPYEAVNASDAPVSCCVGGWTDSTERLAAGCHSCCLPRSSAGAGRRALHARLRWERPRSRDESPCRPRPPSSPRSSPWVLPRTRRC